MSIAEHSPDHTGSMVSKTDATGNESIKADVDAELERIIPQAFSVRCPETASWVVRRIIAAREYAERVRRWSEGEQQRAKKEEERLTFLFGEQLKKWTLGEIS